MKIFKIKTEDANKCITIGYPKIVEDCGITIEEYIKKKYFIFFRTTFNDKFEQYDFKEPLEEVTDDRIIQIAIEHIVKRLYFSDKIFKIYLKNDCLETLKEKNENYHCIWSYRKFNYKKINYKQEYDIKQNLRGIYYIKCLNVKFNDIDIFYRRNKRHNINFHISCNEEIKFYEPVYKTKKYDHINFLFNNEIIKVTKDNIKEKIEETCKLILKKEIITEEDWKLIILNDLMKNV